MIAADYFRRKYLEPLIEKQRKERFARNFAKGLQEGSAEVQAEWEAWYARLLKAKADGVPFDEPAPTGRRP